MRRFPFATVVAAVVVSCPPAWAQLTIVPHYDASITGNPNGAVIQSTIDQVIQVYRTSFNTPITVNITFQNVNTGLACRSLGQARYEAYLREAGFRVVATFTDEGANNYYDVERVR